MANKKKIFLIFLLLIFIPVIALISVPFGYSVSFLGLFDLSVLASVIWILAAVTVTVFYLIIKSNISEALRITGIITSSIFSALLIWFSVLIVFASQFTENTVVGRILSPESTRFAEIVDSDQGALGGNTVVYVKDTLVTDFLLFSVRNEERIYIGELGEEIQIKWINEDCLKINSEEYVIE